MSDTSSRPGARPREIRLRKDTFLRLFGKVPCGRLPGHFERQRERRRREEEREREGEHVPRLDISVRLFSAANECGCGPSTRIARSPMNGARNLACGSPSSTAGTGEVNSWSTSESLLHSRRCELPFEISIFYAYTWVICRRLAYRYRRATQFRLVQRRRGVHLRAYICMYARANAHNRETTLAKGQKSASSFSFSVLGSATTSLTPVESLSRAARHHRIPWSGESRPLCATPVHAFGKWPPILSRDSSPSKWSPLDLNPAAPPIALSCGIATVEDARGTPSKGDGIITRVSPRGEVVVALARERNRRKAI